MSDRAASGRQEDALFDGLSTCPAAGGFSTPASAAGDNSMILIHQIK